MTSTALTQESRQCAQAFSRGVYEDILRWGDSELLTLICLTKKLAHEQTYMDCLRRFYLSMKLHYRCEYVFKNEIIAALSKRYANRRSLVVNEFRVGNSIADIAFFNGESQAYEIKTSYDTPRRLEGQLNDYKRVFDKCYIVVEQSDVNMWKDYDEDMGIIIFCHGTRGKITLEEIRSPKKNNHIDVDVLMTCLRAGEYEYIAEHYAGVTLSECKYRHYEECKTVLKSMDSVLLHQAFLETIEQRQSSFGLLSRVPKELYQVCMSMHLTEKNIDAIIKSLSNNIKR